MDDRIAMFAVIMFGMMLTAYLIAMWIKYRRPLAPPRDKEAASQIESLRVENDRLHERLAVLERIATDPAERTAQAIEQLR
jgi:uncharacterized protein YciW